MKYYYNNLLSNENEKIRSSGIGKDNSHFDNSHLMAFLNASSSPECMDKKEFSCNSNISNNKMDDNITNHSIDHESPLDQSDVLTMDAIDSNCLFNRNRTEKKFISELHINISEPSSYNGYPKHIFTNVRNVNKETRAAQAYEGDNDYELERRISNYSENPKIKKECHHSEKFIYLKSNSSINDNKKSKASIINDSSKGSSSKSVQTSKIVDCMFKLTSDKCVETDFGRRSIEEFELERNQQIIANNKADILKRTKSFTLSNGISMQHINSIEENPVINFKRRQRKYFSKTQNEIENSFTNRDNNADNEIGSYSESCSQPKNDIASYKKKKIVNSNVEFKNNICKSVQSVLNSKDDREQRYNRMQYHLNRSQNPSFLTSKSKDFQVSSNGSFWENPLTSDMKKPSFFAKRIASKPLETFVQTPQKFQQCHDLNSRYKQSRIAKLSVTYTDHKHLLKRGCDGIGSVDNLNDLSFPLHLRFQKSFELGPYDELIKSHFCSTDRRIKSVASKNGCQIIIDGPITLIDPTSTFEAIHNRIAYRCAVAGSSIDRLDKCLNYLKETFPNTCLRLHSRNNVTLKS